MITFKLEDSSYLRKLTKKINGLLANNPYYVKNELIENDMRLKAQNELLQEYQKLGTLEELKELIPPKEITTSELSEHLKKTTSLEFYINENGIYFSLNDTETYSREIHFVKCFQNGKYYFRILHININEIWDRYLMQLWFNETKINEVLPF